MKTKSLIRKLQKAGVNVQHDVNNPRRRYQFVNGNTELTFYDQEGWVATCKTKPCDNYGDDNPFNGNCYNTFHDTIKSAVDYFVNDKHGR